MGAREGEELRKGDSEATARSVKGQITGEVSQKASTAEWGVVM